MEPEPASLLEFIESLVEKLLLTTEFNAQVIRERLESVRAELASMATQYEEAPPPAQRLYGS